MLPKVLAWASLGTALVFVILAVVAIMGMDSLRDTGPALVLWGGIPLLVISILLALAVLVVAAATSES